MNEDEEEDEDKGCFFHSQFETNFVMPNELLEEVTDMQRMCEFQRGKKILRNDKDTFLYHNNFAFWKTSKQQQQQQQGFEFYPHVQRYRRKDT